MRSTAIVHVVKEPCGCRPGEHPRYVATCKDCGWTESSHLRVLLDDSCTGLVQQHRRTCPAMAVTA